MDRGVLINVDRKDLCKINVPFRLHRLKLEATNTIVKIRRLFNNNPDKEFTTKDVHLHVHYGGGQHAHRSIARVLAALEVEGFLVKRHSYTNGSKNYWRKKKC